MSQGFGGGDDRAGVEGESATPSSPVEQVTCPECRAGSIRRHDRCSHCGLSWEDLEAAVAYFRERFA